MSHGRRTLHLYANPIVDRVEQWWSTWRFQTSTRPTWSTCLAIITMKKTIHVFRKQPIAYICRSVHCSIFLVFVFATVRTVPEAFCIRMCPSVSERVSLMCIPKIVKMSKIKVTVGNNRKAMWMQYLCNYTGAIISPKLSHICTWARRRTLDTCNLACTDDHDADDDDDDDEIAYFSVR